MNKTKFTWKQPSAKDEAGRGRGGTTSSVGWYAFTHAISGSSGLFSSFLWPLWWSSTTIHKHWDRSRSQTFPGTHREGTAAVMKQAIPFYFCSSSLSWPVRCVSWASGSYKHWMNPHAVCLSSCMTFQTKKMPSCNWKSSKLLRKRLCNVDFYWVPHFLIVKEAPI